MVAKSSSGEMFRAMSVERKSSHAGTEFRVEQKLASLRLLRCFCSAGRPFNIPHRAHRITRNEDIGTSRGNARSGNRTHLILNCVYNCELTASIPSAGFNTCGVKLGTLRFCRSYRAELHKNTRLSTCLFFTTCTARYVHSGSQYTAKCGRRLMWRCLSLSFVVS